jgi:hypothetical protein
MPALKLRESQDPASATKTKARNFFARFTRAAAGQTRRRSASRRWENSLNFISKLAVVIRPRLREFSVRDQFETSNSHETKAQTCATSGDWHMLEPYVDAARAAEFLSITRRRILELARVGRLPGHPADPGKRNTWLFRLSELANAVSGNQATIPTGSPLAPTRRKHGSGA